MCHKKNPADLAPNSHIMFPENYTLRFVQRVDMNCTNADKIVTLSVCVYCYAEFCTLLKQRPLYEGSNNLSADDTQR